MSQFDGFIFPNKIWKHRDGTTTDHDFYLGGVPYLRLDGPTLQAVREALQAVVDNCDHCTGGTTEDEEGLQSECRLCGQQRAALKLMEGK